VAVFGAGQVATAYIMYGGADRASTGRDVNEQVRHLSSRPSSNIAPCHTCPSIFSIGCLDSAIQTWTDKAYDEYINFIRQRDSVRAFVAFSHSGVLRLMAEGTVVMRLKISLPIRWRVGPDLRFSQPCDQIPAMGGMILLSSSSDLSLHLHHSHGRVIGCTKSAF
jgi:hypothetical protein